MSISEAARADLYTGLADVLGSDRAETLMAHLPRFDAAELATAADMAATRDDVASLRSALKGDIGSLRSELKGDIGSLRSELKDDIAELRSDLKGDIRQIQDGLTAANHRLDKLFLTLVAGLFVVIATMASIVFTIG